MDNTFQIILHSGESIDISCGPGQGKAEEFFLGSQEAIYVACGNSALYIQHQPGNAVTEYYKSLAENRTLTVSCNKSNTDYESKDFAKNFLNFWVLKTAFSSSSFKHKSYRI